MCCVQVMAAAATATVPVSVDIFAESRANGLDIYAVQHDFWLAYQVSEQRFKPLIIAFEVRPLAGRKLKNYSLKLAYLEGRCHQPGSSSSFGNRMVFDIDDKVVTTATYLTFHYGTTGGLHNLKLKFPKIAQGATSQDCQGRVTIMASISI